MDDGGGGGGDDDDDDDDDDDYDIMMMMMHRSMIYRGKWSHGIYEKRRVQSQKRKNSETLK